MKTEKIKQKNIMEAEKKTKIIEQITKGLPEIAEIIQVNENEFKVIFKNQEFLEITLNENSEITHISGNIKEIGDDFLFFNENLESIYLPLLEKAGNNFLYRNKSLKSISLPLLKEAGHNFLRLNKNLKSISLENLKEAGYSFLRFNEKIESVFFSAFGESGTWFFI